MKVVITQSMLFPWVGMLEQIRLADILIHYDDVAFSKGSLSNRVQVKTLQGISWITMPLKNFSLGQSIEEVAVQNPSLWVPKHLALLAESFKGLPYAQEALKIVEQVYSEPHTCVGGFAQASMMALANYYGLLDGKRVVNINELNISGKSSQRVLAVVSAVKGDIYITGHGARKYLNHQDFEHAGIEVCYMDYQSKPYPQIWGEFTPYVTGLDLIANCGPSGIDWIKSQAIPWRNFINRFD